MLNTQSGPLKDVRVRQAVADAIDYKGLVSALKGSAVPASGYIPSGLIGYSPYLGYQQNIEKAKSLLKQAGYGSGGKKLTPDAVARERRRGRGADGVDHQVGHVGDRRRRERADARVADAVGSGEVDEPGEAPGHLPVLLVPRLRRPVLVVHQPLPQRDARRTSTSPTGRTPSTDKAIDSLQQKTATSHTAADTAYVALQKQLLGQAVAVPLYVQNYQRVFQKTMTGYVDNPAYSNVVFVYDVRPS